MCDLPENTVVDGEIVALDDPGRPNFNFLQHSKSQAKRICYFVFDLLVYQNRDLTQLPLNERREILKSVLKFQSPRVRIAEYFQTSAEAMLESAAEQGLEGVVAKRKDSRYEPGKRGGAWAKYRVWPKNSNRLKWCSLRLHLFFSNCVLQSSVIHAV